MSTSYEIDGDIRGPVGAERAMRQAARYLGEGVAGSSIAMKGRLDALGVEGASPLLLSRIIDALLALGRTGNKHADEFARQVRIMRDKVANNPALRNTQAGWLSPKNNL
jgi:hypothetical protein